MRIFKSWLTCSGALYLLVTSHADLEESSFDGDYDVHSIVLPVTVFICAHEAVLSLH